MYTVPLSGVRRARAGWRGGRRPGHDRRDRREPAGVRAVMVAAVHPVTESRSRIYTGRCLAAADTDPPDDPPNLQNMTIDAREPDRGLSGMWGMRERPRSTDPTPSGRSCRSRPCARSPCGGDRLAQPIPGVDHARDKLGRVPPTRGRPAAIGPVRRVLEPPGERILDQRCHRGSNTSSAYAPPASLVAISPVAIV